MEQSNVLKEYNRLWREFDKLYHNIARKLGLSDSAFVILYDLFELGDGSLQKDICKFSAMSKQTVNSAVRHLEREGYLYLKPGNRRDMHMYLTQAGRELVEEKILPVCQMENNVFLEMGEEDRSALIQLTRKYLELLQGKAKELFVNSK